MMGLLGEMQDLGVDCDYIGPGYRINVTGFYVLFYKRSENGVAVVRIQHKNIDFETNL
tara:strand:- start:926 stop:1099 length:174 start_codon:yes stop_codon:yes gene_type:complete